MDNRIIGKNEKKKNELIVPLDIEEFVIDDEKFNDEQIISLHFSHPLLFRLKWIEIGNHCFQHVREFVVDGLVRLESVRIGEGCFKMGYEKRDDGICRITNCPNLRQLEIGYCSFASFQSFELSNVNSLQSIQFDFDCFRYAEEFSLKGE